MSEVFKKRISPRNLASIFRQSFAGFLQDRVTKLSGSLAYATVFSLAPFLALLIGIFGWIYGRDAIQGEVFLQLKGIVGMEVASQLEEMLKSVYIEDRHWSKIAIGVGTMLIGATAVFGEIQDSLNLIWGIKPKPKRGWLKYLQNRFLSFSIIASVGFLLLVSLSVNSVVDALGTRLNHLFPEMAVFLFQLVNSLLSFFMIVSLFMIVFKVLPDAKIKWRDVLPGAMITALCFILGKNLISIYLSKSSIGSTFGASASIVILLLWVYYSAIILYFGAQFTKFWALEFGGKIVPDENAVFVETHEIETTAPKQGG